jgi:hypothetical protein
MAWVFKHYLYARYNEGQERGLSIQLQLKAIKWLTEPGSLNCTTRLEERTKRTEP